jgi:hypothetical protein
MVDRLITVLIFVNVYIIFPLALNTVAVNTLIGGC